MLRLTIILWSLIATVLAGIFVLAVLMVRSFESQIFFYIPVAVAVAAAVAIPIAAMIAKNILRLSSR